jgi:hypothetical protein
MRFHLVAKHDTHIEAQVAVVLHFGPWMMNIAAPLRFLSDALIPASAHGSETPSPIR